MGQRLPIPGADDGDWGEILNGFLEVSHAQDGTLNTNVISNVQVSSAAAIDPTKIAGTAEVTSNKGVANGYAPLNGSSLVPTANLGSGTPSNTNYLRGDGTWVVPNSGSSSLASDTDVSISSPTNNQVLTYNSGLNKWVNQAAPSAPVSTVFGRTGTVTAQSGDYTAAQVGALPSTDDLSAIANANATAGNIAMNSHKITGLTNGSASSDAAAFGQIPTSLPPNGSASGDLSGSYPSPTVAKVNGVGVTGTPTSGQVITATGSTAATWQNSASMKLNYYNVMDYGATGNGTTDDLTSIQSAISAAQTAGGGIVYFPIGTYVVSGQPQVTGSNIIIRGAGWDAKILLAPSSMTSNGQTIGIWVNGGNNVIIEDICVDGNFANIAQNGTFHSASALWSPIINKYGASSVKNYSYAGSGIDSLTYLKYRMPIRITNADNVVVRNCLIQNSISAGVLADSTSVNGCTDILVTNCRLKLIWDNSIYFHEGVQYASAVNNIISDITYNGVCCVYSDHILFEGNNIRFCGPSDSDSGGIQINGSSNCSVVGNLVDQCQFYGITVEASQETNITNGAGGNMVYSTNTEIVGNFVTACNANDYPTHLSPGINFFGAMDTHVASNSINKCDQGIAAGSQAVNTFIVSNRVTNCVAQGIQAGNSVDVINTVIRSNFVAWNGSNGIYCYAASRVENNTILGNTGMGVELATNPSGLAQKIDYVIGNFIFDNTDSGVHANGGTASLAIIERNTFGNTQGVLYKDGVSNGTTTLTSATAAFTAADVNLPVVVVDQGTGGTTTATTIASYTNATTVTLATSLPGTQTGLTFYLGRGSYSYPDGSTTTASNSVLTSATANFTSNDAGKNIMIFSQDPNPVILYVGTINAYTSSTQVTLPTDVGTISACTFIIDRSGQMIRAINNASGQIIDRNNTVLGMPELLNGGGTIQQVSNSSLTIERTTIADHAYTTKAQDRTIVFTSLTAARTVTLANANTIGSVNLNTPLLIKDESGNAGTYNITINTSNSQTIDGAATKVINTNYGYLKLYSNGSNWFTGV